MVNQNQIQNIVLNDLAEKIYDEYLYLQTDTATILPDETGTLLSNGGTQIGINASLFNKLRDTGSLVTKLEDNKLLVQFTLASGEPFSQPVNLGSFGMNNVQDASGGLGFATGLPVTFAKDTNLSARIRAELAIIRTDEV